MRGRVQRVCEPRRHVDRKLAVLLCYIIMWTGWAKCLCVRVVVLGCANQRLLYFMSACFADCLTIIVILWWWSRWWRWWWSADITGWLKENRNADLIVEVQSMYMWLYYTYDHWTMKLTGSHNLCVLMFWFYVSFIWLLRLSLSIPIWLCLNNFCNHMNTILRRNN